MEIAALGLKVQGVDNIDKAEASLNKFTKSAVDAEKSAGGVADGSKKAGTSLADVAKNSNSAGGALGKVASSAKLAAVQLVAVAAAAVSIGQITKTLAGFEQSMASVAAITRASSSEMQAMRTVAKQLGAETEFSASQAADGFMYLGLAGWGAEQSIAAIPSVVDLATAASLGLADAANITSNIMSAYSIEAERATDVTDILAGVSSRANTDVAQLGDAMKYVGPVAASLNISVGDTAAALGVLADASIQGGMGGTALRTVISSLIKPTGDAEKALKAMGLSLSDVNPATNDLSDIVGKLAEKSLSAEQAVTIFGIEGASAISALVAQSPKLAALTEETGDMADEAKRMADVMRDNLQGDLLGLSSALEGVAIAIGEAGLTKALRLAAQGTTALLREMTKLITYMGDNLPVIAGSFAVVFGPQILAAAVGGVKLITAGVVALGGALKAAAFSNPITAAVAATAIFATYLYSIKDDVSAVGAAFDTMGHIAGVVFNEIKDIAVLVFDGIKAALTTVVGIFTDGAGNIEITWLDTFSAIFKAIDAWYGSVLGIVAGIGGAFRAMGENIKIVFNNVRESISNAMLSVSGLLDNIGLGFDVGFFDAGGPREFIDVTEAAKKAFEEMSGSVNTHAKFMGFVLERELKKTGEAADDLAGIAEELAEDLGDGGGGGGGVAGSAKKAADALQTLLDRLFPVDKAAKTLVASIKTLSDAYKKGLIDSDKYKHGLKLLGEEYDNVVIAETKHLKSLDGRLKTAQGALKTLGEQVAVYGKTESAVARLALAETNSSIVTAEAAKAKAIATNASSLHVKQLDIEIKKLHELADAQTKGLALINEKEGMDAVAEIAKEAERVSGDIEKSLTDALLRGFESGKGFAKNLVDTLKNMFNTLVLRPIIQPIAASLAGVVTGALGLGGTAQAGQAMGGGGAGSLGGLSWLTNFGGNVTDTVRNLGNAISTMEGSLGGLGSTIFDSAASIGKFADIAGDVFGYGSAIYDLTKGNYGSAAGGAIGTYFGGPVGSFLGSSLGGMLDKAFKGETRVGGEFYRHSGESARFVGGPSGGYGGEEMLSTMDSVLDNFALTTESLFKALDVNAQVLDTYGSFEGSGKGRGGTQSGGSLMLDGEYLKFGVSGKGSGYGGKSGSVEEMFENMTKDMSFSILEAWQLAADQMPSMIGDLLKDVDIRGLSAEQAQQSVALIQQTVLQVNALIEALDLLPFENLKGLSFDLAASLAEAAGGMDALMMGASSYYDAFFSDQEKYENLLKSTADEVSRLGYELPDARDGFKVLVESLDATDEASHEAIAGLLGLSGAADQIYTYQEMLAEQAQQTVSQVNELIEALDLLPFGNLKGLSLELAASLEEVAGGMDALLAGAASYYRSFFTEQEKYENLLKSTTDEVSKLGYELPDTRDGFRDLVESLDAMDSSNHDAIATLLKLSGTADQVYAYQEKLADQAIKDAQRRTDELAKIAQKEADDAIKAAQDAANERDRVAQQITNTARTIMDTFARISDSISSSFMSLRERITLDIMDNDEDKYNYYKNQYDSLAKQLTQATDENMVQSIVQQMTAAASNAYNLLDEDVRKDGKGQEFIGTLDYAHIQAQQQLDKIKDYQIKQQENSDRVAEEMARLTNDLAKEVANASREINSASENMQSAAANMARAGVGGRVRGTEATI